MNHQLPFQRKPCRGHMRVGVSKKQSGLKNITQVFQTGVPPNRGNTILANIGWSRKSNAELTKSVTVKRMTIFSFRNAVSGPVGAT